MTFTFSSISSFQPEWNLSKQQNQPCLSWRGWWVSLPRLKMFFSLYQTWLVTPVFSSPSSGKNLYLYLDLYLYLGLCLYLYFHLCLFSSLYQTNPIGYTCILLQVEIVKLILTDLYFRKINSFLDKKINYFLDKTKNAEKKIYIFLHVKDNIEIFEINFLIFLYLDLYLYLYLYLYICCKWQYWNIKFETNLFSSASGWCQQTMHWLPLSISCQVKLNLF